MTKLTVERTLLYRGSDGSLTRYEILVNDQSPANNVDSIIVYREKSLEGECFWARTGDNISLDHLGFQQLGGFQKFVPRSGPIPRDVSAAVEECNKHWSKHYA